MDLFRYKSLKSITDNTFQCKGYDTQKVVHSHISFEHFEPRSPGKYLIFFWVHSEKLNKYPHNTPSINHLLYGENAGA